MMRKPELIVWGAVLTGLDDCQQSRAPLATLGEFLEKLRVNAWHVADVQTIENCILELLNWQKEQEIRERKEREHARRSTTLSHL